MIPIAKNIIVVDGQGNEYEATYPKRAEGLVKNGRARFIDENKICLACPPNKLLEDNEMVNDILNSTPKTTDDVIEKTLESILSRIDRILNDDSHIHEAIAAVQNMEVNAGMNNVDGDKARGDAIASAVQSREATNQKIIHLLEKMYDDIRPSQSRKTEEMNRFEQITETLNKYPLPNDMTANLIERIAQQIFVKPGAEIVK